MFHQDLNVYNSVLEFVKAMTLVKLYKLYLKSMSVKLIDIVVLTELFDWILYMG